MLTHTYVPSTWETKERKLQLDKLQSVGGGGDTGTTEQDPISNQKQLGTSEIPHRHLREAGSP